LTCPIQSKSATGTAEIRLNNILKFMGKNDEFQKFQIFYFSSARRRGKKNTKRRWDSETEKS
jgi:hypothetical protein